MPNADSGKHLSLLETINESERPRNKRKGGAPEARGREREAVAYTEAEAVEPRSRTAPVARAEPQYEDLRAEVAEPETETTLPELPQRAKRRPLGGIVSFVMCVILPTVIAGIYYYGYATDQYVSQFKFAVRDISTSVSTSEASQSLTALVGISTTSSMSENYMVVEYMTSRQAVQDLQERIDLKRRYTQPDIDFWSRLNPAAPMERFARYWQTMTKVEYDTVQGTSMAEVRAFTPEDAYLIAKTLLSLGEDLINEVAQRPQRDAVQYAEAEVKRAEDRMRKVAADLAEFRNQSGVIDPMTNLVVSNAAVASTIRGAIAQTQTEIAALRKQGVGANASQVQTLQTRLRASEEQLKAVEAEIARAKVSGDSSIGQVVARYEQLNLERQFAQAMMTSTMQSLEQARANAAAKRLFVTAFVQPGLPQISTHPNRFVAVLTVAGASLLLWTISLLLSRSIKEHLN